MNEYSRQMDIHRILYGNTHFVLCSVLLSRGSQKWELWWKVVLILRYYFLLFSVQFSRWVVSDSLPPHESQHARPPCPSLIPGVYSNSCPLSWWCHPTISSSVIPFNLSQYQGLFQWVSSSHQVTKVLQFQLQHQSFQWIFRTDFL